MTRIDVFWTPDVLLHDTGEGIFEAAPSELLDHPEPHPESPGRVRNMRSLLEHGPLRERITWRAGRVATDEELRLVHRPEYIAKIRELSDHGGGRITPTTVISPGAFRAASAAAGTVVEATTAVLDGSSDRSYALVRPPGHHAQPAEADGYCFFNSVAIAAEVALARNRVDRVAIIDWDVHHGNGTQECFHDRSDVLTVSLHMSHGAWGPSHRQTGGPEEAGTGPGEGYNVNLDLPLGTGDGGYLRAMSGVVIPVVEEFDPDLVIVAAGQDPAQFDPNGRQSVTMAGFRELGRAARELADRVCDGRLVVAQEGGYAPTYAAFCLHATLEGVLRLEPGLPDPLAFLPDDPGHADRAIQRTREELSPWWTSLVRNGQADDLP